MMSLAIDPNTRTVDLKHSKMGKEKCTTDDFKTVVSYTNAIMAYDYERFSRIATSKNTNDVAKELMKDFNALPKSERDKYYRQEKRISINIIKTLNGLDDH